MKIYVESSLTILEREAIEFGIGDKRNVATSDKSGMVWLDLLPIHRRGGITLFPSYNLPRCLTV